MELLWDIVISALLVIGGIFGFVGSLGLVKLPDPMTRLHAPTKSATLGVGAILIASMLWFATKQGHITLHELMVTVFIFLTAPITAHFISKANIFRDWPAETLPEPAGEGEWAVHQADADTSEGELAVKKETEAAREED
ncbi:Na+/H+ antiporter subunit G [Thioclava atlantica]|uniref:Putative monovalent cation/H+ antiporter subunit G n=1 Tax=Thioclava atlantica TaxID=1317124 RepID=A0A085TYC2_9RHOB|nr:Na+/H+ antiporter subunit G [Thioclava atlantica]KFE35719.1 putative monovalent cation/H+ antiporter subunit G [Thioclava atlantica]